MSKILYLVTQSEFGGAQRYILDLATNFSRKGYEITVAAGGKDELFSQLQKIGVKAYQLKNLVREINPIKDFLAYFEIKKLLKDTRPDILHLNSSKAGVLGALVGRQIGIKKIIYTVHGFVFNEPMAVWQKWFYLLAERFSAKFKNKLICVSEFDRAEGIKNKIAPAEKLITVNNGISQINFLTSSEAKINLNLPAEKNIIGTIANFYPTKGLTYLIAAAKIVIREFPQVAFAIIGDGQQKKQLEAEIDKLKLKNNFFLVGQKEKAGQYLRAFDIYICSSLKEGFPFSILEAMQAGLPIVTTKVGGIPEIIKDKENGLLVPAGDAQTLAETIITILKNQELANKLGKQAQIDVNQKFSLARMIAETEKVYHL